MKKTVLIAILSSLLLAGISFAAESERNCSQDDCACSTSGPVFKPLFPEFEHEPPMGG